MGKDTTQKHGTKKGVILNAFPASGKTYLGQQLPNVIDLGKTAFAWVQTPQQQRMDAEQQKGLLQTKNPNWPQNYVEAILKAQNKYDIVLVNYDVLKTLHEQGIAYSIVTPTLDCKQEYIARMQQRGNNSDFVLHMQQAFDAYVTNNLQDPYAEHIYTMNPGQYLYDFICTHPDFAFAQHPNKEYEK